MNIRNILNIFLFQVIIIIILIIVLYNLIMVRISLKKEKRFRAYSIKSINDKHLSIGDRILNKFFKIRENFAKKLSQSNLFKNISKKYYKYQTKDNDLYYPYRLLADKITIMSIFTFIYIISFIINNNFNFLIFIITIFIGYYVLDIILKVYYEYRLKLIENDLLKAIIVMNNAFKSGYNITQAIDIVVKDLHGPISEEFYKISVDLKYGLEVKDVFNRFYERVKLEDAKYITSSLSLLNLTGGNIIGIFSNIEIALTNKKKLRDELMAMTSSSNLVYKVLLGIPVILILLLLLLSPDYFKPLLSSGIGYLIISIIIILYIIYIIIIKRILKVDV
jgi:Flp pilus assembly protein TadB